MISNIGTAVISITVIAALIAGGQIYSKIKEVTDISHDSLSLQIRITGLLFTIAVILFRYN
jgi:hypothetical protein